MTHDTDHIGEMNIERLVSVAYRPEALDEDFVQLIEQELCVAAREFAVVRPQTLPMPAAAPRTRTVQRRFGWAMGLAACVAVGFLIYYAQQKPREPLAGPGPSVKPATPQGPLAVPVTPMPWNGDATEGMKPRGRAAVPQAAPLAVGETLSTRPGERRRVILSDGSVLYMNQNTEVKHPASRRLVLSKGEVYVEVSPRQGGDGATFVIKTPQREVAALGTHFGVQSETKGTGVVVTQGKVKVSGFNKEIESGQQLAPGASTVAPAPRATHVLDWTKELMCAAESPLVPGAKHAGGALVAVDPFGQEMNLTLRKFHIDVHIEDGFARTTIDQTYFNNHNWRLEGTFYFPLPPDASLSRLAMYVEDGNSCKLMEGGMAERDYARQVFETIMYTNRDPALLEWVDGSTFKMRVFPLEGRKEKRIILSYTQRLPSLYGSMKYRFPTGHNMELVRDWSFAARVKHGADWNITSSSHPDMQIAPKGGDMVLAASAKHAKPDKDVSIDISEPVDLTSPRGKSQGEPTHFSTFVHEGNQYLMLRYRPTLAGNARTQRRDWVFLFEASANRDPLLARVQIDVIRTILENAEHDDTFTILTAGTRVSVFDKVPRPATPKNVEEAVKFLEGVHLIGALDLEKALAAVRPFLEDAKNPHLVHVGAGIAALGERKEDVLAQKIPDGVRYVGVGVGKRWSRSFMKLAAERTAGYFTQINPDESTSWRAFDLLATLNTPRLMELSVVDPAENVTFLSDSLALAQGEEVCAIARIDPKMQEIPAKIIVSGKVDGKAFTREIVVKDLVPGAGYLPRTWAKLEIDRLLAQGSDKNKQRIIELSKAMYVMTPFTSLLVLETDADYERFKVDRGRKDHWAMYDCPERIPVVYEPAANANLHMWNPAPQAKDGKKLTVPQVLSTVIVKHGPRVLYNPQYGYNHPPQATTALSYFATGKAAGTRGELKLGKNLEDRKKVLNEFFKFSENGRVAGLDQFGLMASEDFDIFEREAADVAESKPLWRFEAKLKRHSLLAAKRSDETFQGIFAGTESPLVIGTDLSGTFAAPPASLLPTDGPSSATTKSMPFAPFAVMGSPGPSGPMAGPLPSLQLSQSLGEQPMGVMKVLDDLILHQNIVDADEKLPAGWLDGLSYRITHGQNHRAVLYYRPHFTGDQRIFGDLTLYAPGMNTTATDLQAVVEAEAAADPKRPLLVGVIDPAARKLIDRARSESWFAVSITPHPALPPKGKESDGFSVSANGAGMFAYERTLSFGLKERVICDGKTLLHLYPEIGLGATRTMSRFHHAQLQSLVPWALPATEDLAKGADLKLIDEATVAIVPLGPKAKDDAGKDKPWFQVHLTFAADGRLAERQFVAMPAAKVHLRQTFDADGAVRWIDADNKVLAEVKLHKRTTLAPDLAPDTSTLVLVPLPLRTFGYYHARLKDWNGRYDKVDADTAVALMAAYCMSQNVWQALQIFGDRFHVNGDRRLGFYTLLAASNNGINLKTAHQWHKGPIQFNPEAEHPTSPLAKYLAYHLNTMTFGQQGPLGDLGGAPGSLLEKLGKFRDLWFVWNNGQANNGTETERKKRRDEALQFVKECKIPVFAWVLLEAVQRHSSGELKMYQELAEAHKAFTAVPELRYAARYEFASGLARAGIQAEALKHFKELYADTVKGGGLPLIDHAFQQAFQRQQSGQTFAQFMREVAGQFVQEKRPLNLLVLAWQCWQLGDQPLADELFSTLLAIPSTQERIPYLVAGIEYLWQTSQWARADALVQQILADETMAKRAAAWRLAAVITRQRGMLARSVAYLEKAMDMEYEDMPALVNLQTVRSDYTALLGHYQQLATAVTMLETEPPKEFLAKVIRAADRWRALDPEATQVCRLTARILQSLGAHELAWDYLTTPIGMKPNEAAPWLNLAHTLRSDGSFDLADRAFAMAFQAEPTNAQILWERAQNLQQTGKVVEARRLYQQIADSTWQPRFTWLQNQAKWYLQNK